MGTLYVVGAPAGDPDDLTQRARRILGEVALVVAVEAEAARRLLDHHGLATPLSAGADLRAALEELPEGDVALLLPGWSPVPSGPGLELLRTALERGYPPVPIPGPSLPATALVLSGLPADAFVYLGELPRQPQARRALLASVADEPRTLVAGVGADPLPDALADLSAVLGDRPLFLQAGTGETHAEPWRGSLAEALAAGAELGAEGRFILVIGGATDEPAAWSEERLRDEIRGRLAEGLRTKEISHELAEESGWRRREIYRLTVEESKLFSPH